MACRKKSVFLFLGGVYCVLVVISMVNYCSRCVTEVPLADREHTLRDSKYCRPDFPNLGLSTLDLRSELTWATVESANTAVGLGGSWQPSDCEPWQRVAIIISYRDRESHLVRVLDRLHPLMRKQRITYQIFVVEQEGQDTFNKGRLYNAAAAAVLQLGGFDCLIFHDVDLVPENERNIYYCDNHVRHLCPAIDELRYHVMYYNLLGGVVAINQENFKRVNGFSNEYWGWGFEDDDFSVRTEGRGLLIVRPPDHIGMYKMIRHEKRDLKPSRFDQFLTWESRWPTDGLNNIDSPGMASIVTTEQRKLYTHILVNVGTPKPLPSDDVERISVFWLLQHFFP